MRKTGLLRECKIQCCTILKGRGFASLSALAGEGSMEYKRFVEDCRVDFMERGFCHVPSFLGAETVGGMLQEVKALTQAQESFYSTETHTVYQEDVDPGYPPSHVRNLPQRSSKIIVDYDRLPPLSPLRRLYSSEALARFVAAVVGHPRLFLSGCPYNAAYYNVFRGGDGLGWHFDKSHFGVGIELQTAGRGGRFEIHHHTRSEDDLWSFDTVSPIIRTGERGREVVGIGPGSLVLFAGRLSMHRVTPVEVEAASGGDRDIDREVRINAVMTYEVAEGMRPGPYSLKKFFGRG